MKDLPDLVGGFVKAIQQASGPVRKPDTGLAARAGVSLETRHRPVLETMGAAQLRQLQYLELCARALSQMAQFERERILAQRDAHTHIGNGAPELAFEGAGNFQALHAVSKAYEANNLATTAAGEWEVYFGEENGDQP